MKVWFNTKKISFNQINVFPSQLSALFILIVTLVWTAEAAKGGAKSVINRKRPRGRGNTYIGNNHSDDGVDTATRGETTHYTTVMALTRSVPLVSRHGTHHWQWQLWLWAVCRSLLLHQEERNTAQPGHEGEAEGQETLHWTLLSQEEKEQQERGENWYIWNLTCCCSQHHYFTIFYLLHEKKFLITGVGLILFFVICFKMSQWDGKKIQITQFTLLACSRIISIITISSGVFISS